jgi:hypothetical protein
MSSFDLPELDLRALIFGAIVDQYKPRPAPATPRLCGPAVVQPFGMSAVISWLGVGREVFGNLW